MRTLRTLTLLALIPLASLRAADQPPSKPNILFLFADDQRADTIAALGNPIIQTPNLDRLVKSGLTFNRAYMQGGMNAATCVPSRAMLLSGRTLFHIDEKLIRDETWPAAFGRAGYTTFITGKWHNDTPSVFKVARSSLPGSFQIGRSIAGGMDNPMKAQLITFTNGIAGKPETSPQHACAVFADETIRFLSEHKDGPFFAYLPFDAPHDPHIVPEDFPIHYDAAKIPLPPNFLPQHPWDNGEMTIRDEQLLPWPRPPEQVRAFIAEYYRYISYLDSQIGRILDALEASPYAENTIVVFSADSGVARGSHGLIGKQNLYEHSIRVPLIISGPGIPAGKQTDAMCYLFDVLPTLGKLCQVNGPTTSEGIEFTPTLHDPAKPARSQLMFAYKDVQRAARDERWKLIRYPQIDKTQLFDLQADPFETNNLATQPNQAKKIAELTALLEKEMQHDGDTAPLTVQNPKPAEWSAQELAAPNAKDATILFYGNSMVERLLEHGEMEARVQLAEPGKNLHFRSLAWTGDEVANRLRAEGYAAHLKELLAAWPAKVVVLGYGLNESFAGAAGLPAFRTALAGHLDQLARLHPGAKFVLLSPIATEGDAARTAVVKLYADALADAAKTRGALFVDLFTPTAQSKVPLTSNGIHLNDDGNRAMARVVATALAGEAAAQVDPAHLKEVAAAAAQLAYYTAEVVRPKNGILYYGQRKRPEERAAEMPLYMQRIEKADALVHRLVGDPAAKFADAPFIALAPLPVVTDRGSKSGVGTVKSPAEMQAELKVADGYAVNLFASEEQFPELRAPVQIAFDARGRLWVVTMPSFPHTVPGQPQEDKIIVLEDTDHDGKADKCTTFAGGFDALDGIAFTENGALIGEQSRHWLMRDTDGDGRADTKTEMLRGLDVTDSHHGGMVATDPVGGVWFSDGVFHRSQFETPFGVHRGFDATTYRQDPRTGRIETEWQSLTPNPWRVTFDRTGNVFQMYGGGHVLDGLLLTWTPLGIYHPYAYGKVLDYGKGSGAASVSSPNFPDEYQQGIANGVLLGPYVVTLTKCDFSEGAVRGSERLDLLSSPNPAFRPVDMNFGFDGALYVSDFSSAIIGHAQNPMRDARWNHTKGRIWRVVYNNKPIVKDWPRIEGASATELCALLTRPQDIVRHHARIELRKLGQPALAAVDAWVSTKKGDDQAVLEALFVCESLGETRPALLAALLGSKSPLHRAAAVHLVRLQAARLPDFLALLQRVAADEHPRVRMEVVDAIAHLRPSLPQVEQLTHAFHGEQNGSVKQMLADLSHGTTPRLGSSVPVLEMLPETRLAKWNALGDGNYRTFIRSDAAQPAVLAVKYSFLDVSLNGVQVLSFDSQWSSEQQARLELLPGLNTLDITYRKLKAAPPAVHLFSPAGGKLDGAQTAADDAQLATFSAEWEKTNATLGKALRVQAVPNQMQFAPRELRVEAGAKVRLIFNNPDLMMHNFVLLARGAEEEIGALADKLAADPDGMAKGYIPASPKILLATPLVAPNTKSELTFDAPKEPGEYPYLCTFPGHWRVMRGVLIVSAQKPPAAPRAPAQSKATAMKIGEGVVFETASSQSGFTTLVPPAQKSGKVSSNRKTTNDPIDTLTDGKLEKGFGPVFANGIEDGAYKLDLGKPQPITAITSWSHHQSGKRGAQRITLYGSASASDPGWEVTDTARFTSLGTISTDGQTLQDFTALSRRSADGKPLGNFQWIVWQVSPVTPLAENTAIQELAVEVAASAKGVK